MFTKRAESLFQKMLPFWQSLRDDVHGGYTGLVDENLKVCPEADKGCIYHSRILWFFATAARTRGDESLLPYARHAYEFLRDRLRDRAEGRELGFFWSVHQDGSPADTSKYTYCQAFALYALAAYARASGEQEPLELAQMTAALIEHACRDRHGYVDALSRELEPLHFAYKLSENGILAERTMNTLLHVVEALAELRRACGESWVAERLRRDLTLFRDCVYLPEEKRLNVFYRADMSSQLDIQSYGHDIEAAWLLADAAEALDDPDFAGSLRPMLDTLTESVYERAFRDGSLMAERVRGEDDPKRVWWVQAEAANGFLWYARRYPEREAYHAAVADLLSYIEEHLVDPRPGSEWIAERDGEGKIAPGHPIAESWKGPYHNGRMCLLLSRGL